mmetsp:Transcript_64097/g.111772  ORF Transcript_64097/g.111772 Transcript_64097/m.111772 type:complete len:452 (+) Transcript_64097:60-1415(+)
MRTLVVFGCILTAGLMPARSAGDAIDDESVFLQLPATTHQTVATHQQTKHVIALRSNLPATHQTERAKARGKLPDRQSRPPTWHQKKRGHAPSKSAVLRRAESHLQPKARAAAAKRKFRLLPQHLGKQNLSPRERTLILRQLRQELRQARTKSIHAAHDPDKSKYPRENGADAPMSMTAVWPAPDDPSLEITDDDRRVVKAFKDAVAENDPLKINATVEHLALIPPQLNYDEGTYDLVFQTIREHQGEEHQYLQQSSWSGLSDQSSTELGARTIANIGGPNQGVVFMIDQLLLHPLYSGYRENQLTVQSTIMLNMAGLLSLDNNKTIGPAAIQEGLVPAVMRTLMGESELIASQAAACKAMKALFMRNPETVTFFRDAGAYLYVMNAMERFEDGDDTPFAYGFTMGHKYNVTEECYYPAVLMYADDLKWQWIDELKDWKPWMNISVYPRMM